MKRLHLIKVHRPARGGLPPGFFSTDVLRHVQRAAHSCLVSSPQAVLAAVLAFVMDVPVAVVGVSGSGITSTGHIAAELLGGGVELFETGPLGHRSPWLNRFKAAPLWTTTASTLPHRAEDIPSWPGPLPHIDPLPEDRPDDLRVQVAMALAALHGNPPIITRQWWVLAEQICELSRKASS